MTQWTERTGGRKSWGLPAGQRLETSNLNYLEKWVHGNPACTKMNFWQRDFYTASTCPGLFSAFLDPGNWIPTTWSTCRGEGAGDGQGHKSGKSGVRAFLEELGYPEGVTNWFFVQDIGQRDQGNQHCKSNGLCVTQPQQLAGSGGQPGVGKGKCTATGQSHSHKLAVCL